MTLKLGRSIVEALTLNEQIMFVTYAKYFWIAFRARTPRTVLPYGRPSIVQRLHTPSATSTVMRKTESSVGCSWERKGAYGLPFVHEVAPGPTQGRTWTHTGGRKTLGCQICMEWPPRSRKSIKNHRGKPYVESVNACNADSRTVSR